MDEEIGVVGQCVAVVRCREGSLERALGGARVAVAQAAAAAILTVTLVDGEGGMERLVDALIGTGVALVFSQFLFSPEPLRFLRRAETDALSNMARALRLTAQALAADGPDLAEQAKGFVMGDTRSADTTR